MRAVCHEPAVSGVCVLCTGLLERREINNSLTHPHDLLATTTRKMLGSLHRNNF